MDVTATEFKNRLGRYLDAAEKDPVIIKKSGRVKSVLISHEMYQKYLAMEDVYWAQRAKQAESEGYLGDDETLKILRRTE
jgi:antitoxin Phd